MNQIENSLPFGMRIPESSYIEEDSIMAEVIDAVEGEKHFDLARKTQVQKDLGVLMLNEEESFIGVADFEQEVVKGSYINN